MSSGSSKKKQAKRKSRSPNTPKCKMDDHGYADENQFSVLEVDGDFFPIPATPTSSPAPKKACGGDEPSLHSILKAVNDRAYEVKGLINRNSEDIKEIQKSIGFMYGEIDDLKKDNLMLKTKCEKLETEVVKLQGRVADAESYKGRWCLRLYGVPEHDGENVKEKVIAICEKVAPALGSKIVDGIDVAHRLGRRDDVNKNRGIIILFVYRWVKDEIWNCSKVSKYVTENKLQFRQYLSKEDKEAREAVWPVIAKARAEGKRAYYVGRRGFVEGKEIRLAS